MMLLSRQEWINTTDGSIVHLNQIESDGRKYNWFIVQQAFVDFENTRTIVDFIDGLEGKIFWCGNNVNSFKKNYIGSTVETWAFEKKSDAMAWVLRWS